jgi:large subunit ribosomal protein L4
VHGPKPRDYSYRFPRKKLRGALRSALSAKLSENLVTVVEGLPLESHKTREFNKILNTFGIGGKVLVIDSTGEKNLLLSLRNLPAVKLVHGAAVNIFDVVNSDALLFSRDAILEVQEALSK